VPGTKSTASFNYLICTQQERFRERYSKRPGGPEIDDQFEFRRLLDRVRIKITNRHTSSFLAILACVLVAIARLLPDRRKFAVCLDRPLGNYPTRAIGTSWHDRRPSGVCLLRPDPFGDVELHSAAECFIAQMRICDLGVGIVRDGHEPNEAEEQRPCCVPIEPIHVISSPEDRREQEGYQNSGSFGEKSLG